MLFNSLRMQTPLGELALVSDGEYLLSVDFCIGQTSGGVLADTLSGKADPVLELARSELTEYFQGCRRSFSVPYRLLGRPFQMKVWRELARIPFGQTISYGELASRTGNPRACRAVGQANNKNPLAIIIPCHRVIGKDGSLVGYGGGLDKKAWLLGFEKKHIG